MTARKRQEKVNNASVDKELAEIDKLFRELEKDKTLPTFGDHFMLCMVLGVAENVNLKRMYPRTYFKLSKWLEQHNRSVLAWQKKNRK